MWINEHVIDATLIECFLFLCKLVFSNSINKQFAQTLGKKLS